MLTYFQILLLGCSLALDAFAVTVAHSISGNERPLKERSSLWRLPLAFALFQGAMPLLGCAAGYLALSHFETFAGLVSAAVLFAVGANMIYQSLKPGKDDVVSNLNAGVILASAVATSIDALAVGVTLPEMAVNPFISAGIIAGVTLLICFAGIFLGRRGGSMIKMKNPEIIGGIVIILIGLKTLIQHLV